MKSLFLRLTLLSLTLMACAVISQGMNTPTPQQIPVTVEVTRQVIVTQEVIVEVPVEVTPTPTVEPTPEVEFVSFISANAGVKMSYPVTWFTYNSSAESGHMLAFAPDPELIPAHLDNLEDFANPPNMVALLWVVKGDTTEMAEFRAVNPVAILDMFMGDVEPGDIYLEPEALIINGQLAAKTAFLHTGDDGAQMVFTVALILGEESITFFFAGSRPENYARADFIFNTMLESIQLDWTGK